MTLQDQESEDASNSVKLSIKLMLWSIILFIFRMGMPLFKYPALILAGLAILVLLPRLFMIKPRLFLTAKTLIPIILSFIYFITASLFTQKMFLIVFKDILNIVFLLTTVLYLLWISQRKNELLFIKETIFEAVVFLSFIVNIFMIVTFLEIGYLSIEFLSDVSFMDTNFSLIPGFLSMLIIAEKSHKYINPKSRIYFTVLTIIFILNLILSGSRRGIVLYILLISILLIIYFYVILRKKKYASAFFLKLQILSFLIGTGIVFSVFFIPNTYKSSLLEYKSEDDALNIKTKITMIFYRMSTLIDNNYSYDDIYRNLWYLDFDSNNPKSGWASGKYTIITQFEGNGSENIPKSASGMRLDSSSLYTYDGSQAYCANIIRWYPVKSSTKYKASIFCYASESFNADDLRFAIHGATIFVNLVDKYAASIYDLNNKGTWQKLEFEYEIVKDGELALITYFTRYNKKNFDDLTGYVIFAYPEIKLIEEGKVDTSFSDLLIHHQKKNLVQKSGIISNASSLLSMLFFNQELEDKDWIRKMASDLVSEDSTYYPYKADITVDSVGRDLGQDRLIRWKFALDLFVKEYTWKEKIFGGGFDFLSWYGKVFHNNHMRPDYPHNPFLHILLYGGLVGLSLYFWLLARVLQLYWRYRKEYGIFLLMWGVVYYFTLFSGGDPFNPPVMGFFMLLPFLIHAVHQREAKE